MSEVRINTQEQLKDSVVEFWTEFLKKMNLKSLLFKKLKPSALERKYIHGLTDISGVSCALSIVKSSARPELYIDTKSQRKNKIIFDQLGDAKNEIQKQFGESFEWKRLNDRDASRIIAPIMVNVSFLNKDDRSKMIDFMIDSILRMEKAFKEPLLSIKSKL